MEIVVSNKTSRPLYEQISTQIKSQIMNGELKAGEALPSIRALAKSLHSDVFSHRHPMNFSQQIQPTYAVNTRIFCYLCLLLTSKAETTLTIWKSKVKSYLPFPK